MHEIVRSIRVAGMIIGLIVVADAFAASDSPYSGMEGREIKSLSPEEVSGYLAGHGMGFAMPAELNSYPGPKHVLELAAELELSDEQRQKAQIIFDAMHEQAVALGDRFVGREQDLDGLFASGEIDDEKLHSVVAELGQIRAELRYAHLVAHLQMRQVLTDRQVMHYDMLRGYGEAGGHGHHAGGHDGHGND